MQQLLAVSSIDAASTRCHNQNSSQCGLRLADVDTLYGKQCCRRATVVRYQPLPVVPTFPGCRLLFRAKGLRYTAIVFLLLWPPYQRGFHRPACCCYLYSCVVTGLSFRRGTFSCLPRWMQPCTRTRGRLRRPQAPTATTPWTSPCFWSRSVLGYSAFYV